MKLTHNNKAGLFYKLCLVVIYLLSVDMLFAQVRLNYGFSPGERYYYSFEVNSNSTVTPPGYPEISQNESWNSDFVIDAVAYRDGLIIVDLEDSVSSVRRYIDRRGQIVGSPSEVGADMPLLIIFPEGEVSEGHRWQNQTQLNVGQRSLDAVWNMKLESIENGLAKIIFAASLNLPSSNTRQKAFRLSGRTVFDVNRGIIKQANWQSNYELMYSNREMAIERGLWRVLKTKTYRLKLMNNEE